MITKDLIRKKLDEALAVALEEKCSEISDSILEAVDIHKTEHHIDKMVHHAAEAKKHNALAFKAQSPKESQNHIKLSKQHAKAHNKHKTIVQKHHDELVKQIAALKRAK